MQETDVTSLANERCGSGPPTCDLSFVIPIYNEAENIEMLSRRIEKTCIDLGIDRYEVILVENGSWDDSEAIIRRLHRENPRMKMIQLSRNFGYQGAVSAGLCFSRGEWVAVLDGDQQDPPELIGKMLQKARDGYDVVYGIRAKRRERWLKRAAYAAFYRIWRATAAVNVPLDAGDFCVMRRNVVRCITAMPERLRFVRGLRAWTGFRQTGLRYEREARGAGSSKFGLGGMIALAVDGLLSYSVVPLRVMTFSGLVVASGSFLIGFIQAVFRLMAWLSIATPAGILPPGLTQVNLMITFLIGFNIVCVGIVGEYIGRIYEEVKGRPAFIVRSWLFDGDETHGGVSTETTSENR